MTLTYFFTVKDENRDHLGILTVVISQTVTDRASLTIADKYEVTYCLSNGVFTFDLGQI